MYLNATSFQARHHWHPHNNLQVLSGIQASAQSNNNGVTAEERLIDDSDQYDVGLYSSLSCPQFKKGIVPVDINLSKRSTLKLNFTSFDSSWSML